MTAEIAQSRSRRRRPKSRGVLRLRFTPTMSGFALATLAVLFLALVVGGASRDNTIASSLIQAACLLLLPFSLYRIANDRLAGGVADVLWVIAVIVVAPLIQLAPLPPEIWTLVPGRELSADVYKAANGALPWAPLSLTPAHTLRAWLSLTVPVTIFLAVVSLSPSERLFAAIAVLVAVVLGLALGAAQFAGGPESSAYLYQVTNPESLVGLFANRNHEATMLLCALPLVAALINLKGARDRGRWLLPVLCGCLLLAIMLALAAARSRAGILLLAPAAFFSLALIWRSFSRRRMRLRLVVTSMIGVAVVVAGIGMITIFDRLGNSLGDDIRFKVAPDVWRAALAHLPFGSGVGSFDSVYRSVERLSMVQPEFVNHAHNDYLELWLEAGWLAVAALGGFLYVFARRAWTVWKASERQDIALARAGAIVVGLILMHSALDYPLRTPALAALFALGFGLMTLPPGAGPSLRREPRSDALA